MFRSTSIIALTFLVAMIFMVIPLPEAIIWLRPQWVLMVLIFWLFAMPARVGLFAAFFVGLLVDLLLAAKLGEHALIYTCVGYFVVKYATRIQLYLLLQKTLLVLVLVFLAQLLEFWLQGLFGLYLTDWRYWLSTLSSAILWPWVYMLLSDIKRRFIS